MASYKNNRIIPIVLIVIIIAIAIAAIVSLGRAVFSGSSSSTSTTQVDISRDALLSTTADRKVSMTVRGPIVAQESFRSYRIEVTPSSRTITTYTGYLDQVVSTQTLSNNVPAYEQFVHALDNANLAKGTQLTGDKDTTLGICATGRVIEFNIINGKDSIKHLWTSTCSGSKGSLNASVSQVSNLFTQQIPDSSRLISAVNL